jgi:hypothetical protein
MSNPSTNYLLSSLSPTFNDDEQDSSNNQNNNNVKSILIATIPKVPALLSITCSSLIIQKIARSPTRRKNIFHRIMLGLSISDVCSSSVYFLGTWLVPKGSMTVGGHGPVYWAAGTTDTCQLSGFFTQAAMAGPFYNSTLACYYLLTIYYNWPDWRLKSVQHWFHILPIGWAIMTSVIALSLKLYGNVDWLCWILPDDREDGTLAQRNFVVFQWVFLFGPLWCCIFFVSGVMFLLWKKMRENEKKMDKYRFSTKCGSKFDWITAENGELKKSSTEILCVKNDNHEGDASFSAKTSVSEDMSDWRALRKKGIKCITQKEASVSASSSGLEARSSEGANTHEDNTGMTIYDFLSTASEPKHMSSIDCSADASLSLVSNEHNESSNQTNGECHETNEIPSASDMICTNDMEQGPNHVAMDSDSKELPISNHNSSSSLKVSSFQWNHLLRESSLRRQNKVDRKASFSTRRLQLYNRASRSRQIAIQGMLYLCAFYVTWLFPTIKRLMELGNKNSFVVQFLDSTLLPLQGLFNFIIYMRPRLLAYRRVNKDIGFWQALWNVVWEK